MSEIEWETRSGGRAALLPAEAKQAAWEAGALRACFPALVRVTGLEPAWDRSH